MKTFNTMVAGAVALLMMLCVARISEAARGCDAQDEKQWEKMRDKLPTSDIYNIPIIIHDLTKLKDKCDPKTRFSASVVQLLIRANFRQDELREALKHVQDYNKRPIQSPTYDPGSMPTRAGPSTN